MMPISPSLARAGRILLALTVAAVAAASLAAPARPHSCDGAIRHPLTVRVRPLGPIERGRSLALEVEVSAARALSRGEVEMVATGGASAAGARTGTFGAVAAGEAARTQFTIDVPREGQRFLIQFRVRGEGDGGLLQRGATYNLLPDGPADPGRWFTTPEGVRIAEYRARRVAR